MMLIELFAPKGHLSDAQRRHLSQRMLAELFKVEDEHPTSVIEQSLAISQVIVHEPESWIVGGHAIEADEPPRFVVRATVPGAWRREMSEHLITVITRVLAENDENPQRLYEEPHAWVHVVGVPEGGSGTLGRVMRADDILKRVTQEFRHERKRYLAGRQPEPGTAIDPICGMTVPLTAGALTLEHEGTVYGFCSAGCRALFAEELRGEVVE